MLIEYVDLQCPICQEFETREMGPLVKKYVRPGKLKIKMQPWSILDYAPDIHDSTRGQKATIAAARQNKAFNFAEVLYDNQGVEGTHWMNDAMISKIAASVDRLRPYKLAKDANGRATRRVIKSITHWAKTHPTQMTGTPTLYLVRGRGRPKYYGTGIPPLAKLEAAINALLK
jgi:protein-disulfide isomerase